MAPIQDVRWSNHLCCRKHSCIAFDPCATWRGTQHGERKLVARDLPPQDNQPLLICKPGAVIRTLECSLPHNAVGDVVERSQQVLFLFLSQLPAGAPVITPQGRSLSVEGNLTYLGI